MTAPVFAVVNPTAGSGRTGAVWLEVAARLRALGLDYQFEATQGPLTAESFVRQALRSGAETILVVGGDGTVNEAMNGLFWDDVLIRDDVRFLIVPAGSSSDVARGLAIPAGAAAVNLIREGQLLSIDIGRAEVTENGRPTMRYFLNNADVGVGARIASGGTRFKRAGGRVAFFVSSLLALANPQPWMGRLRLDDGEAAPAHVVSVVVALGPYTGGGMAIAPAAKWDDGLFDVVTIDAMGPVELLTAFPRVYNGSHLDHPKVHHARASRVVVETAERPPIEVDGEVVGAGGAEFRVLRAALPVYVPRP